MLDNMPGTLLHGRLQVENARLNGPLGIGNNVSVGKNSVIVGPVVIGDNTTIGDNVLIGPYTSIGNVVQHRQRHPHPSSASMTA